MAYADSLNAKIDSVYVSAGSAVSDLAGVVSGADVLASQFADVKTAMQDLQSFMNELKSAYWYVPVGLISPFGGTYANRPPSGWLFCDGSTLNASASVEYANLFSVIGTQYGGSGISSFKVPDLRARVPLGATDQASGSAPSLDAGLSSRAHGTKYGSESTTLTSSHIPQHYHDLSGHTHTGTYGGSSSVSGTLNGSTTVTGYIARSNGTGGAWNGLSPGVGTAVSYPSSVSGGLSGSASVSGTSDGPSNNNSGNYGTASPSAVTAVQPSVTVSFIIKF